ncbi:MAG: hypothetical protein IJK81_03200 [Selenomonadaceae bacterium]|nr:hypothetical protein [Selenomonadaceae bacterium]
MSLQLSRAGFGSTDFWMSRPLVDLPDWLELANDIAKREQAKLEQLKRRHR